MRLLLIVGLLLAFGATAFAQRGETTNARNATTSDEMMEKLGRDPVPYSRSVKGTILAVDSTRGSVVIEDSRKTRMEFIVDRKARLRADKNTDLAGRTSLSLIDYQPGNAVKVIYRISDNKALEVRLRRPQN